MRDKFQRDVRKNYQKERDLLIERVDKGIVHPLELSETGEAENKAFGGVTDSQFNFIELSLDKRSIGDGNVPVADWYVGANPKNFDRKIKFIDEEVVFIGPIKRHFAHFYLETLSRCWFFLDKNNLKYKIAFLSSELDTPRFDLVHDIFKCLGITPDYLIEVKEPTQFKTVIIPEQSYELNMSFHMQYKKLIDEVKLKIKPMNYKKVYFAKLPERSIGEDEVIDLFESNGYKVFTPEYLSAEDMIAILKGCEEFVASSGSNAYNALFLNDEAKLTVLNRSEHVHPTQTMIDEMRNFDTTYVDCFTDILPVSWDCGPFMFLYTKHLEEYLKSKSMKYKISKFEDDKSYQQKYLFFICKWCDFYSNPIYCRLLGLNKRKFAEHIFEFWRKLPFKVEDFNELSTCKKLSLLERIFSIKNGSNHKILRIFGIKISFRKKNIKRRKNA
jgi:hypothetical protein